MATTSMGMICGVEGRVLRRLWSGIAISIVAICLVAQPIRILAQSAADVSISADRDGAG